MARHRISMTRSRWRMCLFGLTYYLCAVIILENIIAVVYWNSSYSPVDSPVASSDEAEQDAVVSEAQRTRSSGALNWSRIGALSDIMRVSLQVERNDIGQIVVKTVLRPEAVERSMTTTLKTTATTTSHPKLEELERDFYKVRETKVNPYLYDIILSPRSLCDRETFMIILIHSHHSNTERRTAIRNTWGSVTQNGSWPTLTEAISEKIKLVFVFGTHKDAGLNDLIREEWHKFDDVVQGNFMDSYQNMTLKSLLGLKLVSQHCAAAKYLFKNDDDMFINVPYLVSVLRNRTLHRAIMGPLNVGSKVYRNGKWKLSRTDFPFQFYPPYESGAAYLITCDIVRELYETSEYVPSIFIDDVYITGILGRILNVTHERQQGFAYWTNKAPSACDIVANKIISGTKMTPSLLTSTWDEMKKGPSCRTILQVSIWQGICSGKPRTALL